MEEIAPADLAESWDNVGLQIGFRNQSVAKVLLSLDIDVKVIDEAVKIGADMIITHHPLFFDAVKAVDTADPVGKAAAAAIKNEISVFSAHTNLDKAKSGVSDALAETLGLIDVGPLIRESGDLYKLVVFVPLESLKAVKKALGDAGAGKIGNYSHCSFETGGTGAFRPLAGAAPAIGAVGKLTEVDEVKVEVIVNKHALSKTLKAMLTVHPYEEVAYDVYPLKNQDPETGTGRTGVLEKALNLKEFTGVCRRRLKVVPRVAGSAGKIKKVAVCGGSGGGLVEAAIKSGSQVLVTGDLRYHQAKLAYNLGFCVLDCQHDVTEKVVLNKLKNRLSEKLIGTEFVISTTPTSPWKNNV